MADVFDHATAREEMDREQALAAQQAAAAAAPRIRPLGHCLNPACGEPFPANDNRLFCGRDCADEHARRCRK